MLLQSKNHFYIHENKSKYLFSLHPLIMAYYLANDRHSPEMMQKIKDDYSPQELDLYHLIEKDFRLTVSLDGDKENNSFRIKQDGENSFDDLIANMELLKEFNSSYLDKNVYHPHQYLHYLRFSFQINETATWIL